MPPSPLLPIPTAPLFDPEPPELELPDDPEPDPLDPDLPPLDPVGAAPAAPALPDGLSADAAEGSLEIVVQVPPLVVVFWLYARKLTWPEVVSWTSALVEA